MKMKKQAVMAMCGIGAGTIYRYMDSGFFPKRIPNTKMWESNTQRAILNFGQIIFKNSPTKYKIFITD